MEEPKPFASLGPTLLARKGGAKPAMRPQVSPLSLDLGEDEQTHDLDDLGWNDMGDEDPVHRREAQVLQLTPYSGGGDEDFDDESAEYEGEEAAGDDLPAAAYAEPAVIRQGRAIAEAVKAAAPARPARTAAPAPAPRARRAAFTLRLDAERHLKLRLASTVTNQSAQILVTEALDKFLREMPELEALAAQVKRD